MNATPPPLASQPPHISSNRRVQLVVGLALISTVVVGTLVVLRIFGLICPYSIPTGAMTPSVSAGDHVIMEGITYLFRQPHRGDIAVFKSEGITALAPHTSYIKRVAGEPGERIRLSDDQLYVNDKLTVLTNGFGGITYGMPRLPQGVAPRIFPTQTNLIVPDGCYFLLGDRATNSFDSRFFGSIARRNITGRIWFCYWPPQRVGFVR